jgi:hypothetical protein
VLVVAFAELVDGSANLGQTTKTVNPERLSFEDAKKRSIRLLPSGCRTKAGDDSIPTNWISFWKSPLIYPLP